MLKALTFRIKKLIKQAVIQIYFLVGPIKLKNERNSLKLLKWSYSIKKLKLKAARIITDGFYIKLYKCFFNHAQ